MQAPRRPRRKTRPAASRSAAGPRPYFDEALGASLGQIFGQPFDLLLGPQDLRYLSPRTGPYVADPNAPIRRDLQPGDEIRRIGAATPKLAWRNSRLLGSDVVAALTTLKGDDGPDLLVQGSKRPVADPCGRAALVDEFSLLIFPIVLGRGKRLFGGRRHPGRG